ncbi:hypothetical protein SO694_00053160 [Aureococcus anophagefferens]|uniref:MYND-type domain-containing protein n=1 Tax=Aureococcus anophagefferens TaxID=44056 RepID=A0ABR1FY32_AURAN
MPQDPPCAACGIAGASLRCGRCKGVKYCTPFCQKRHWPAHKRRCKVGGAVLDFGDGPGAAPRPSTTFRGGEAARRVGARRGSGRRGVDVPLVAARRRRAALRRARAAARGRRAREIRGGRCVAADGAGARRLARGRRDARSGPRRAGELRQCGLTYLRLAGDRLDLDALGDVALRDDLAAALEALHAAPAAPATATAFRRQRRRSSARTRWAELSHVALLGDDDAGDGGDDAFAGGPFASHLPGARAPDAVRAVVWECWGETLRVLDVSAKLRAGDAAFLARLLPRLEDLSLNARCPATSGRRRRRARSRADNARASRRSLSRHAAGPTFAGLQRLADELPLLTTLFLYAASAGVGPGWAFTLRAPCPRLEIPASHSFLVDASSLEAPTRPPPYSPS